MTLNLRLEPNVWRKLTKPPRFSFHNYACTHPGIVISFVKIWGCLYSQKLNNYYEWVVQANRSGLKTQPFLPSVWLPTLILEIKPLPCSCVCSEDTLFWHTLISLLEWDTVRNSFGDVPQAIHIFKFKARSERPKTNVPQSLIFLQKSLQYPVFWLRPKIWV